MALVQSNFNQSFQPSSGGEQSLVSFMNNMYKHTAGGLAVVVLLLTLFIQLDSLLFYLLDYIHGLSFLLHSV